MASHYLREDDEISIVAFAHLAPKHAHAHEGEDEEGDHDKGDDVENRAESANQCINDDPHPVVTLHQPAPERFRLRVQGVQLLSVQGTVRVCDALRMPVYLRMLMIPEGSQDPAHAHDAAYATSRKNTSLLHKGQAENEEVDDVPARAKITLTREEQALRSLGIWSRECGGLVARAVVWNGWIVCGEGPICIMRAEGCGLREEKSCGMNRNSGQRRTVQRKRGESRGRYVCMYACMQICMYVRMYVMYLFSPARVYGH